MQKAMTIAYAVGRNLYLNITNRCPCACTFCIRTMCDGAYGSDPLWLEHEPSMEEIRAALDKEDLSQYEEVVFCGYGEPTERLDILCETAKLLKSRGVKTIRINTNGLVRSDSRQKNGGRSERSGGYRVRQSECRDRGGISESHSPQVRCGGVSGNAAVCAGLQAVCAAGDVQRGRHSAAAGTGCGAAAGRPPGDSPAHPPV